MGNQAKPKIYISCSDVPAWTPDVVGMAVAEDGTVLEGHISSGEGWSHRDMQTPDKIRTYEQHYPGGYDLVWLGKIPQDWDGLPQEVKDASSSTV